MLLSPVQEETRLSSAGRSHDRTHPRLERLLVSLRHSFHAETRNIKRKTEKMQQQIFYFIKMK